VEVFARSASKGLGTPLSSMAHMIMARVDPVQVYI
jgi:hypothetical protein